MPEAAPSHSGSPSSAPLLDFADDTVWAQKFPLYKHTQIKPDCDTASDWQLSDFDDFLPEYRRRLGRLATPEPTEGDDNAPKDRLTAEYLIQRLVPGFRPLRTEMESIGEKIAEICKSDDIPEDDLPRDIICFNNVAIRGAEVGLTFPTMSSRPRLPQTSWQLEMDWKEEALDWMRDAERQCCIWKHVLDYRTKASAPSEGRPGPASRASRVSTVSSQGLDKESTV